jgi:pyocin large subunit-like protein
MSIDAMRWAKKVKTGKSSSKAILTWLADMCGADLCAYPSVAALAEATELDRKTVHAGLRHLMETGLIEDTGERRGRTKQIPVYRLTGVEESVVDAGHTQKREPLKVPKNGPVTDKAPENGCVKNDQRHPFFPLKTPKNGSRNLSGNHKDLTPSYGESGSSQVEPVEMVPEYPDQPGFGFPAGQGFGKFSIFAEWKPSPEFSRQARLWGTPVRQGLNLAAELNSFIAYWQAEGKVFHQIQWEQKFARHLSRAKARNNPETGGTDNAGVRTEPTASRAVQQIDAAYQEWCRRHGVHGDEDRMAAVAGYGGDILEPMDAEERGGAFLPLDCPDWFDD